MQWIWLMVGAALLISAWLVTLFLRRRGRSIHVSGTVLRLLLKAARIHPVTTDVLALHACARTLTEALMRLKRQIRHSPALPAGEDGAPRLMELAHDIADEGVFTTESLRTVLSDWQCTATPSEVSVLPHCVAAAQCKRLERVLHAILADAKERNAAARLLRRLLKARQPAALLSKSALRTIGLAELMTLLRQHDPDRLLPIAEEWLSEHGLTSEAMTQHALSRQMQLAGELRRTADCFSALSRMDWLPCCSEADALHPLLESDPDGLYPRLDAASQLALRLQAEALALHTHLDTETVVRQALILANEADAATQERSVCFWFQDASGLKRLHHALPSRKGWLYARLSLCRSGMNYAFLWSFGIITGFLFLQGGGPVFMLPFFALVTGCISRWVVRKFPKPALPRLTLSEDASQLRTLVVMPAVLHDTHEAIRMVRRIKTAMHAFPGDVDFLLLGDFSPAITPVSSGDQAIIHAAASAAAALENERVMYMQRARVWDSSAHRYAPRGGGLGALTEVCRLIAQGECEDVLAYSTVEAARFERQYAYVLALPPHCQPAPGMFEALMSAMAHPHCSRRATPEGWQGYSVLTPEGHAQFEGVGLIRPDAFLEATDGHLPPHIVDYSLCGELAGHASVPGAHVRTISAKDSWSDLYAGAQRAWTLFPWQLPLVQTPSGLVSNPLGRMSRFRLREKLRTSLVPLGQFALLLYALLVQDWPLLLLALTVPFIGSSLRRPEDALSILCRLSLLPTAMAVPLRAGVDLLRRRSAEPSWVTLEIWAQGIAATVMTALGIAMPGFSVPALALGALFGSFPLAHRFLDTPSAPAKGLTEQHTALLERIASSTWRFFVANTADTNHCLPPVSVQFEPALGAELQTSPEAVAASLLACVCAQELGFLRADAAAQHISAIADALRELYLPCGLPCRRYALPSLAVADARVDARACGIFLCALMTAAQALRSWLAELSPEHADLSAQLEAFAASLDIKRLYDPQAGLFFEGLDKDGQPVGYADFFADESLLLSVAACARGIIKPDHFTRLSRTKVRCHNWDLPLSAHGTAAENLLASLFLPTDDHAAAAFIHTMIHAGQDGLFGQGECGVFDFDPALRYRRAVFGLRKAAANHVLSAPVYAPYATSLCLPRMPLEAAEALMRFEALGALGQEGFCDAADLTQGTALVGMRDALHQGIILVAAAHLLADSPIRRYFCALPQVEACLPLLDEAHPPLLLPALPLLSPVRRETAAQERIADVRFHPAEAHVLGNEDFRLVADAWGNTLIFDGELPLTRMSDEPPFGLQFYLADEGRICRLGCPDLGGTVTFLPGEVRYEQVLGSLRAELIVTVDTVQQRALHIVTITNLSTRDRLIDLADCLIPDLLASAGILESSQPEKGCLLLRDCKTGRLLHHTVDVITPPLSQCACTDVASFLGRGRTLHAPASLEEPLHDQVIPSIEPCLSFRLRLALGGRGQITAWFTTSLTDAPSPQLQELTSIRRLAALQHAAIDAAAPLSPEHALTVQRMLMPLMAANCRITLLSEELLPVFIEDLAAILRWLALHGISVVLAAPKRAEELLLEHMPVKVALYPPDELPSCPLSFRGDLPLSAQVDAMRSALPPSAEAKRPVPSRLPEKELLHQCTYGGFDPETTDYIMQLEPRMTTPAPWGNRHNSRHFSETVNENGFQAPFREQVWLWQEDGTRLSPWSEELPRAVRIGLDETAWEAWSDTLDIRLTAACLPGHRCGMRVLRIRNASDNSQQITIAVLAQLSPYAPLECGPGLVTASNPAAVPLPFLAGDGWHARRLVFPLSDHAQIHNIPDDEQGRFAVLSCRLTLAPHASGKAVWLAGFARHSEDIARALTDVHVHSTSDVLRSIRSHWAQRLGALTISTPEDTLDLLMNRILPAQGLYASDGLSVLILMHLSPPDAKRALLQTARLAQSRDALSSLALLTERYVRITGDKSVLDVLLPLHDAPLYACCAQSILNQPLDRQGLPMGDDPARRCFLYAAAAQALDRLRPDENLSEWSRKLLQAADTHLWQDGWYGDPLRLDVQSLAALAFGASPRIRQALQTCWSVLYDRPHGLIKSHEATDAPALPGLPENGGMRTQDAALYLHALLKTGLNDEAFELLQALNPLHHTDDPLRMETFRCAPYLLHGGMWASPLQAGRAAPEGGSNAAAILYATVLADIFRLHREGSVIRMNPCVPPEWEDFTLTLREGSSTWRISAERKINALTIDGEEIGGDHFSLTDDGHVHRVRFPLK